MTGVESANAGRSLGPFKRLRERTGPNHDPRSFLMSLPIWAACAACCRFTVDSRCYEVLLLMIPLTLLVAWDPRQNGPWRRILAIFGGLGLLPAVFWVLFSGIVGIHGKRLMVLEIPQSLYGWIGFLSGLLAVGFLLARRRVLLYIVALLWALAVVQTHWQGPFRIDTSLQLGGAGLLLWGILEGLPWLFPLGAVLFFLPFVSLSPDLIATTCLAFIPVLAALAWKFTRRRWFRSRLWSWAGGPGFDTSHVGSHRYTYLLLGLAGMALWYFLLAQGITLLGYPILKYENTRYYDIKYELSYVAGKLDQYKLKHGKYPELSTYSQMVGPSSPLVDEHFPFGLHILDPWDHPIKAYSTVDRYHLECAGEPFNRKAFPPFYLNSKN